MYNFSTLKPRLFFIFLLSNLLSINYVNSQVWEEHNIFSESGGLGVNPKIGSGDVDNDGDIDVIINDFNAICYFANDGNGNFGSKITIATGWGLHWGNNLIFVDQEGDGDFDILTANNDGEVNWLINNGAGSFSDLLVGQLSHKMNDLDLKDIDGDNDLDVVTATFVSANSGERLVWFENTGPQDYTMHTLATNVGFRKFVNALDIDGDDDIDILTFTSNNGTLRWYENDGVGNFSSSMTIETDFDEDILDFHVSDFDGDGLLDILYSTKTTGTSVTAWRKNNGNATFSSTMPINATGAVGLFSISHSFPIDFNLDGHIDVLATGTYNDELSIFLNDGIGNFELFDNVFKNADLAPYHSCAGDFNGDGILDPACYYDTDPSSTNHDNISWYESDIVPSITTELIDLSCQNNETPFDGTDDFLRATIEISSDFLNQDFTAYVISGSVSPNNIVSNNGSIAFEFEPGSAGGGDRILTIANVQNSASFQNISIEDTGNCMTSSTTTILEEIQVVLAPNPTNDIVKLLTETMSVDIVSVYDIFGRELAIVERNNLIDLSSFKAGTYVLKIQLDNEHVISKKVIKY